MNATFDLNIRNLISIGIFSAVYFAIVYACGFMGFGGPLFVVLSYLLAALINGPVMMLFMARTPTAGALSIFGIINGILFVVAGFPWHVGAGLFALAVVADVIASSGGYRNPMRNVLAYAVLSVWFVIPWLPILINADQYFADMAAKWGSEDFVKPMRDFYQPWVIWAWIAGEFIVGALSGLFGVKIFTKHFVKAGMV